MAVRPTHAATWLVAACLAIGGLASKAEGQASTDADNVQADTLQRLRGGGSHLRLGYRTDAAPFSFLGGSGPEGYTVELCALIAKRLAVETGPFEIRWVRVDAANRFEALETGAIDILCGATSATPARAARMGFTTTTYLTDSTVLVTADAYDAGAWGERIGVLGATTSSDTLTALLAQAGGEFTVVVAFENRPEAMAALRSGEVDSLFGDRAILAALAAAEPEAFRVGKDSFGDERYALAARLFDAALLAHADATLEDARRSGRLDAIRDVWFPGVDGPR